MARRRRNQHAAKRKRARIRLLNEQQGRGRPIIERHGNKAGVIKKEGLRSIVVYKVVLTKGPRYSFQQSDWKRSIMVWCNKSNSEAEAIISDASRYANGMKDDPPVLILCSSKNIAMRHQLRFHESMKGAIEIIES